MIELKNVRAGYGKKTVIENACMNIGRGRLTCVVGRNGCGKSTLLKTAAGILQADHGNVLIDGRDVAGLSRKDVARSLSYLSQTQSVADMSVWQLVLHGRFPYITYPGRYGEKDFDIADKAIKRMGLSEHLNSALSSLSGGMCQKAYIAMSLAQNTDYILLDEPTTFLDVYSQLELMKILRELADENKGVVIVMHDLLMAFRFCDEIVVMDNGQIRAVGSADEIYRQDLVKEIFGVDLERKNENEYYYRF